METNLAVYKSLRCWNGTTKIESGETAHLTARVAWVEGETLVRAVAVDDAMLVENPELKCRLDLDDEWLILTVQGPAEIPARATVVVRLRREVAVWLPKHEAARISATIEAGELL